MLQQKGVPIQKFQDFLRLHFKLVTYSSTFLFYEHSVFLGPYDFF